MSDPKAPEVVKDNPSIGEMLDSRFIRWFDLCSTKEDGKYLEPKMIIQKVVVEMVFIPNANRKEKKIVLWFQGKDKALIMCKTNIKVLMAKYGENAANWAGKEITLYVDENVKFQGKKVNGVRIR